MGSAEIRPPPQGPLLWVLLPFSSGLLLSFSFSPPLLPVLLSFLALTGLLLFLLRSARHSILLPGLVGGIIAAFGWLWCEWRFPPPDADVQAQWKRPPREACFELKISTLYRYDGQRPSTGIARILEAEPHLDHLRGERLYFELWPDHGDRPLVPSTRMNAIGVLIPIPPDSSAIPKRDFDAYLNQRGIHLRFDTGATTRITDPGHPFRIWCARQNARFIRILDHTPGFFDRAASIWKAMMLGETGFLSQEIKSSFRHTGTMHLFAISGLHIGIIAAILAGFLRRIGIPLRLTPLAGIPVLFLFVQITGNAPSAVRALVMVAFFWSALCFSRKPVPFAAWSASALFVLFLDPRQLVNPAFQLSYSVVAMILLYGLPLAGFLKHHIIPFRQVPRDLLGPVQRRLQGLVKGLWDSFAISLSAFLISQPITIFYFGIFSPVSVPLNLFLVLLAFPVIFSGILCLSLGQILPAAWLLPLQLLACGVLEIMLWLIRAGESLPGSWVAATGANEVLTGGTVLLLLTLAWAGCRSRESQKQNRWLAAPPLAFLFLLPLFLI